MLAAVLLCAWLPTLAPAADDAPRYTVRRGDNLSLIGRRLGVTIAQLQRANGLDSDVIHVDQVLAVPGALNRLKAADVRWSRPLPAGGKVLRTFGTYKQGKIVLPSTGTDIACEPGTPVTAPAHGIVRHAGAMSGVGTVVILEHGGSWSSVLTPLDPSTITAQSGQIVLRGDVIAKTARPEVGSEVPHLHVELRRDNKAVAPDRLLR